MTDIAVTSFPALGTTAVIAAPPATLARAEAVVRTEVAAIDQACSRFRPDSELVALNRMAGEWVEVGPVLLAAVRAALTAARQTDGDVDPTIGRTLRLLGYERDFAEMRTADANRAETVPGCRDLGPDAGDGAPDAIVRAVPGWQTVRVDTGRSRVRAPAGVELDLGATAKALAADRASARASETTGVGVLVGLGGDLSMSGSAPVGGWRVWVTDDSAGPAGEQGEEVWVGPGGLATSSTTVRTWKRSGRTHHHIVDPRTGSSSRGPWRTVTVAAATCVDANVASTAAIVRGESAPAWLCSCALPARLVTISGAVQVVSGWPGCGANG